MIRNYFTLFQRLIQRHPVYFLINLVGLTVGITGCLIIMLYVQFEFSYDKFHSKLDQLYRVNYNYIAGETETLSPSVPVFVGPELKKQFPEVQDAVRLMKDWRPRTIKYEDKFFDESGFCWADPNLFKVMDFKAKSGDPSVALSRPGTVIITESIAKKYFGDADPIGKMLTSNNARDYEVAAVIEDIPSNSHFTFTILTSLYSIKDFDESISWNNPNYTTFLLLKPDVNVAALKNKIEEWVNPPAQRNADSKNSVHLELEPLRDVHFDTRAGNFGNDLGVTDPRYLMIFISIAIAILIIACVNYINLSTARATMRAKEVGMRKVSGASVKQLFFQFLYESFLIVLPAMAMSVLIVKLTLPVINNLFGKVIPFSLTDGTFLLTIVTSCVALSFLSGIYPALVLTRFKPATVLKGRYAQSTYGLALRKALVVFQFSVSTVLIAGTLIILQQLQYMQSKTLGLDKEHVVVIDGNADINKQIDSFAERLRALPGVNDVSKTWRSPFETVIGNGFYYEGQPDNGREPVTVGGICADEHYLSTLNLQLVSGRNFDPTKINGDSTIHEYIVNETFLADFGLTAETALGKKANLGMLDNGEGVIVGVVKDFHTASLHSRVRPIVLFNFPIYALLIKVGAGTVAPVISLIEQEWKTTSPQRPFHYSFLDDQYDAMYRTEQRVSVLISVFSGVAIFIACLGLLGLSAYTSSQRIKEIGIRKVLGATSAQIIRLLGQGYLTLLIIAVLVAAPVCLYLTNQWLANFAYKVETGPMPFALATLIIIVISFVTIGYQSYTASVSNPADSLRNE